jgi:hypothetical protein
MGRMGSGEDTEPEGDGEGMKKTPKKLGGSEKNMFLCGNDKIKRDMTNTITIDQELYRGAEDYAQRHNQSVRQLVEDYIHELLKPTALPHKKSELDLAREDVEAGRLIAYSSKEELFKDLGI